MARVFRFFTVLLRGEPLSSPGPVHTDFMVVQPSFGSGVATLVDLSAPAGLYSFALTPDDIDARAMYADWRVVGQDLKAAMETMRPVLAKEVDAREIDPAHAVTH